MACRKKEDFSEKRRQPVSGIPASLFRGVPGRVEGRRPRSDAILTPEPVSQRVASANLETAIERLDDLP